MSDERQRRLIIENEALRQENEAHRLKISRLGAELEAMRAREWLWAYGIDPRGNLSEPLLSRTDTHILCSPMYEAAAEGNLSVCKFLFNNGAAKDIHSNYVFDDRLGGSQEETPMHGAAARGHLHVAQWLLDVGSAASIRAVSKMRRTAMFLACEKGHLDVARWLAGAGARDDTRLCDSREATPMLVACEGGHLSVAQWLFEAGSVDDLSQPDNCDRTPMLAACENGHLHVVKWLVSVGRRADIRAPDDDGWTPMFTACYGEHLGIARYLFSAGAEEDVRTSSCDETPLCCAFRRSKVGVAAWLLVHGAANDQTSGHVDAIILRDSTTGGLLIEVRSAIAALVLTHYAFIEVLFCCGRTPRSSDGADTNAAVSALVILGGYETTIMQQVAAFAEILQGRFLRNAREILVYSGIVLSMPSGPSGVPRGS